VKLNLFQLNERLRKRIEQQVQADISARNSRQAAKLESNPGDAPLETKEVQGRTAARFRVCIRSKRRRLLDEDNTCEKYLVDALRYGGVIPDDSPDQCSIEVSQAKCGKGEVEEIEVEVEEITPL